MPPLETQPETRPEPTDPHRPAPAEIAPPAEAETPPASLPPRRTRTYDSLAHHELITLIDEIDDERARARFREAVYISVIFWLLFTLVIVYGPRYLWHTPVIVAVPTDRQHQSTLTYLDTPPDVAKLHRTQPAPHISERSTEAQSPRPSPRIPEPRAGTPQPPAPQPRAAQPVPQPAQPAPQPQQQAQQQPQPQRAPQRPSPAPLVDAPAPSAQRQPNFNNGSSAAEAIQQAARNARSGGEAGDYGNTGRGISGGAKMGTEVLSDTQGVDFGKYLNRLLSDIKRNWLPLIPEEARPPLNKKGVTGIRFTIQPDGRISAMNLDYSTHDVAIDRAAWGSIRALGQAQPLPKEFHGPYLELRVEFDVNKDPQ